MSAVVVAFGAISALGEGKDACSAGVVGEAARVAIARDPELERAGLARPFAARANVAPGPMERGTALLVDATLACARELDRVRPGWRRLRVGLSIGTSSGGMRSAEKLFRGDVAVAEEATYFAGIQVAARALGIDVEPATLVLGACASATIAIGLGMRWLAAGACDIVLAGGFDAVSVFVAAGFEVLKATSAEVPPRPFRMGRDGMALGEGAAVLALAYPSAPPGKGEVRIAGFGASADAVHLTAPDRSGAGLARAAAAALADAGVAGHDVGLVSAHATATPFNDAAEAHAIATALGAGSSAVIHPFKAQIGHTLGAAGALETLVCVDAIERGLLPAAAGRGPIDPDAAVRLLDVATRGSPRVALKLSAAFGGANAALVIARAGGDVTRPRPARDAYLVGAAHVAQDDESASAAALAARLGWSVDRAGRADALSRRALAAIALLAGRHGPLDGAAVVVGQAFATLETNLVFNARIDERGARQAEPRRFPYTSPNAVAGEASIAFGLTGPSFAVGSGLHAGVEALAVGAQLVQAGDADDVVVVATDEVGPAVALALANDCFAFASPVSGAVAVLLSSAPRGRAARIAGARVRIAAGAPRAPVLVGHLALVGLAASAGAAFPAFVEASMPLADDRAAYARVDLDAVRRR